MALAVPFKRITMKTYLVQIDEITKKSAVTNIPTIRPHSPNGKYILMGQDKILNSTDIVYIKGKWNEISTNKNK
jgi:hypothetical protein